MTLVNLLPRRAAPRLSAPSTMESQAVARRPLPPLPARVVEAVAPRTAFSPQRFRPTSTGGSGARLRPLVASAVTTQREAGATYTVATPLARVSVDSLQYESGVLGAITERTRPAVGEERPNGALTPMEYLTNVLSSRVYDVAIESPLQLAPKLSERLGVNLWLKREDLQPVMISIPSVAAGKRMPSLFPFGYYCCCSNGISSLFHPVRMYGFAPSGFYSHLYISTFISLRPYYCFGKCGLLHFLESHILGHFASLTLSILPLFLCFVDSGSGTIKSRGSSKMDRKLLSSP